MKKKIPFKIAHPILFSLLVGGVLAVIHMILIGDIQTSSFVFGIIAGYLLFHRDTEEGKKK